jgi:hypothetical protein
MPACDSASDMPSWLPAWPSGVTSSHVQSGGSFLHCMQPFIRQSRLCRQGTVSDLLPSLFECQSHVLGCSVRMFIAVGCTGPFEAKLTLPARSAVCDPAAVAAGLADLCDDEVLTDLAVFDARGRLLFGRRVLRAGQPLLLGGPQLARPVTIKPVAVHASLAYAVQRGAD